MLKFWPIVFNPIIQARNLFYYLNPKTPTPNACMKLESFPVQPQPCRRPSTSGMVLLAAVPSPFVANRRPLLFGIEAAPFICASSIDPLFLGIVLPAMPWPSQVCGGSLRSRGGKEEIRRHQVKSWSEIIFPPFFLLSCMWVKGDTTRRKVIDSYKYED